MTQAELAAQLNWNRRRIGLIEGSDEPVDFRLSDAVRLARALGLRPAYFVEAMEAKMTPASGASLDDKPAEPDDLLEGDL